jgi:hypothetical protein
VQDGRTDHASGTGLEVCSAAYGRVVNSIGVGNDGGRKRERKNVQGGALTIGMVDTIVGEGGLEIPGFKATQYEAIQIVKHWAGEMLDLDFDYFLYGSTGSSEWRTREYANRRLNTIAKLIGRKK